MGPTAGPARLAAALACNTSTHATEGTLAALNCNHEGTAKGVEDQTCGRNDRRATQRIGGSPNVSGISIRLPSRMT